MPFTNEQHRQRYARDPGYRQRKLTANNVYHAEHRQRLNRRRRELWQAQRGKRYGLTADDLARMLREQDGACAICKRRPARWLCIDHCHATKKVRGLLCHKCNAALGFLGDDVDRLRRAAAYLDRARGVGEARPGCRAETAVAAAGAAFAVSVAAAVQVLGMRAEVGQFRLAGYASS